jgi:hypothetical protein
LEKSEKAGKFRPKIRPASDIICWSLLSNAAEFSGIFDIDKNPDISTILTLDFFSLPRAVVSAPGKSTLLL